MAGYSEDIVTRIVNVQWVSGLAVIFGKEAEDAPPFHPTPTPHIGQEDA